MNINDKQKTKIAQSVAVIAFALAALAAAVHFTDSREAETQSELVEVETETGKKKLTEAMLAVTNEMAEKYAGIDMEAETVESNSEEAEASTGITIESSDTNPDWVQHTLDNLPEHETYDYKEYVGDYSDINYLTEYDLSKIEQGKYDTMLIDIYYSLGLTTDQFEESGKTLYYHYDGYVSCVYLVDNEDIACVTNFEVIYVFPLTDEYTGFYDWGD